MRMFGPCQKRCVVLLPIVLAVTQACSRSDWPPPPETRIDEVTDTIHGVAITDPYRWLEEQEAAEVRDWLAQQNAYADSVVGSSPLRQRFEARLRDLMDTPDVGAPRRAGDWEYFTLRRPGEEVAAVYRREAQDSATRIDPAATYEKILDPLSIDPAGTTSIAVQDISADGRLMIYAVRHGGPDETEIRVLDLQRRTDLADRLPPALYGNVGFDHAGSGFHYIHRSRETGPRVKYHRLHSDIELDSVVWGDGVEPTAFISMNDIDDGRYRIYTVQHGWQRTDVYLQNLRSNGPIREVARDLPARFSPQWSGGRLLMLTNLDAPRNRIALVDPRDPAPERWRTIVPEGDDVIDSFTVIADTLYISTLHNVATRILKYTLDGEPAGEVELPPHSVASIRGTGPGRLMLTQTSLTQPSVTWRVNMATGEREVWERDEAAFDTTGIAVQQVWYTSKDGTRAPMYIMHRRDIELNGDNPTLLYGYGGFNVSLLPRFDTRGAAWIAEGGVYAVATLRGGGEFGEDWHRAGMLENKQNVFDDFIAAAEWLIDNRYTSPSRLAIRGGSNGGLLVGAAITQRPELYRAALIGVPDLDMVRFVAFERNNNKPALLEYGDASDPEQFEFLRRYSPYQNVREGTHYPAVMFQTGDLDTRVPPLQARKMTARLQAATRSGYPVILHYDDRVGHAGGRPQSHVIRDAAMELTFLMQQLGFPDGAASNAN
jgi:prolyl oligopeptidase